MGKPGSSRARQQAMFRRRRQMLLFATCVFMGSSGAVFGMVGRTMFGGSLLSGLHQVRHPENVLVVGVDDNYDPHGHRIENKRARTDTIMLVTVRPDHHSLHVLSIPRDTQVLIPGYGTEKINAAHAIGGTPRTKDVVENLLGITVDHTIEVSLGGAADFLDQLGGVDVFVEQPMHYEDHTAKLTIDFKQGWQHLDGHSAVRFARFRHDALGDIGRVSRQQHLMHAVEQKLLNPINWWRMPQLAKAAGSLFKSDFANGDFLALANFAKGHPATTYTTLPGDFGYGGYWIPNHSRIVSLMDGLNNEHATPKAGGGAPVTVEILYAQGEEQAATKLATALGDRGLAVVRSAPVTNGSSSATRVIGRNGNPTQNATLNSMLPNAPWQLSDDPSAYSADYTVVLGPDYR